MEELNIYVFTRTFLGGGTHDWLVQATETEINLLKELEMKEYRVVDVIVTKATDPEVKFTHQFDSSGQMWCKMPINIFN